MARIGLGVIGAGDIARATCHECAGYAGVDIVAVADPNAERAELALRAGKHVLLEKPFAMRLAEAQRVADAAQASGRTCMAGMNQRFGAAAQVAKGMVARGDPGRAVHAKAFWRRRIGSWFTRKEAAGCWTAACICSMWRCVRRKTSSRRASAARPAPTLARAAAAAGALGVRRPTLRRGRLRHRPGEARRWCHGMRKSVLSAVPARRERLPNRAGAASAREPRPATSSTLFSAATSRLTIAQSLAAQRILDGLHRSAETGDEVKL